MDVQSQGYPILPRKSFFKVIIPWKLSYWLKALLPRKPKWMCRGMLSLTDKWSFKDHPSTQTIVLTQSWLFGHLSHECAEQSLPNITDEWPFQDHLPSKAIILICSIVSRQTLTSSITNKWPFLHHIQCILTNNKSYIPLC